MEIKKWRGLNNVTSPERFGQQGFLDAADNVDLDDTGKVITRLGTSLAAAGSYHSLWADGDTCLVMSGNALKRVNPDYSLTSLATLLASRRVSYNRQLNTVYFSNGIDTGRVENGAVLNWGIRPPVSQPVATATGGRLPPGRYQYALVYRRANGQESGTGIAGLVELPERGGVAFSSVEASTDPEVVDKCIYLSGPNGEELFRALTLDNMASGATYDGDGYDLGARLETQFDNPPPPGDIVESHNGVMYCVKGGVAWHSARYQLERFCSRDRFLQFSGSVGLFAAVNSGIFVGTESSVVFLEGTGPGDFKHKQLFDYGAIPMAFSKATLGAVKTKEEAEEGSPSGPAVVWASPRGICFGFDDGSALNMTETECSLPRARRGAALVRQARGYTQFVVALEGAQVAPSDAYA